MMKRRCCSPTRPSFFFHDLRGVDVAAMSDGLPSDSALKAYLEKRVHGAKEISLLSRAILKDGIADQFHLTEEQREELDLDSRYKKLIKVWIQEAIVGVHQR